MTAMKKTVYRNVMSLFIINILWWVFSAILNKNMLPSPIAVYQHLFTISPSLLWLHIYNSLLRLFWGMLISVIIGLAIGLLMGRNPKWNEILDPFVYMTYPIPKIALLPIIMLLFGLGNVSKIILLVLIIVFQVILSVRDGVKNIPESYYQNLRVLGANSWQQFYHITAPAALSSILSALRIALGTAIAILFFTEVYGTSYGLGYFIMDAWSRLDYLDMYSGIVILSIVAFLLFLGIDTLEKHVLKWRNHT